MSDPMAPGQLHMQTPCTLRANDHADLAIRDMEALRGERDAAIKAVEELRAENLKSRQSLRKESNEFQDLRVQYEQRESEVIALRKELNSYQGNEIDYRAECVKFQKEIDRLRRLLKLAIAQEQAIGLIEKRLRARKE